MIATIITMDILSITYRIIAVVLALTLHEFMHAFVADRLGDPTAAREGRITLNPLAHIDPFMTLLMPALLILAGSPIVFGAAKPVPFNPWALRYGRVGAAMVAAAGPLTNLFLAIAVAAWLRMVPISDPTLLLTIMITNIGFFVFNMIPFPPLDGSRLLYAVMPYQGREVMDRIERAGLTAVFLFLFVAYPIIQPFMAAAVRFLINLLIGSGVGLI
jgi:Zn-dependent protease